MNRDMLIECTGAPGGGKTTTALAIALGYQYRSKRSYIIEPTQGSAKQVSGLLHVLLAANDPNPNPYRDGVNRFATPLVRVVDAALFLKDLSHGRVADHGPAVVICDSADRIAPPHMVEIRDWCESSRVPLVIFADTPTWRWRGSWNGRGGLG